MNSPFPGMDPYLEQHWTSVHHRLITYAGDRLQLELPQRFRVEVEERVFVLGPPEDQRSIAPDVSVVRKSKAGRTERTPKDNTAIVEPVVIELDDEPITETYLEIVDTAAGNKVVTALEFLSPTNKCTSGGSIRPGGKLPRAIRPPVGRTRGGQNHPRPIYLGDGCDMYVKKQREYRAAGVNQVEIDLTRSGDRSLVFPILHIPPRHRALYLACVRRGRHPTRIEAYPMPLQAPLPSLAVPLAPEETDVSLDLQSLVAQCYRNGRYDDIDYRQAVDPPLPSEDADWAARRPRDAGLR